MRGEHGRGQSRIVRLFEHAAKGLLPPEFYKEYGAQMVESFEQLYSEAQRRSWLVPAGLIAREFHSILVTAVRERRRGTMTPSWFGRGPGRRVGTDVRIAFRGFVRSPAIGLLATLTIAFGVTVTVTAFALWIDS